MTADEELGLVYLPFGTPTNDWYGGHRLGDNLFAESLVALDCETGERSWHYQTIRHGLWDYDLVTPPILGDITVNGREMKVAAQLSKQGFVYVFDARTGKAVWPIEDRPVPRSTVPGERSAPTQPFPSKPPAYERQGMHEGQLIDFTPEIPAQGEGDHGAVRLRSALYASLAARRLEPARLGRRRELARAAPSIRRPAGSTCLR